MTDLELLFSRQPPYSDDDLRKIITHFREQRARYLAGGAKPRKGTTEKAASIDLAEIGLEEPKPLPEIKLL